MFSPAAAKPVNPPVNNPSPVAKPLNPPVNNASPAAIPPAPIPDDAIFQQ